MIRFRFSLGLSSALLIAGACRGRQGSDPVPASLPGSYIYAAEGSTLKKSWQFAARLDLKPDRTYTITLDKTLDKTVDSEKDPIERSVGNYVVSGNHVLIRDTDDGDASKDFHKLLIKSDSLIPEVGWTAQIFLKGVGAPNIVLVKEHRR